MSFHSRFTPSIMSGEHLEALFVQREDLASRTVEHLRETVKGGGVRADLLVGPRGIGKTHFIALLRHRIDGDPSLADHLAVAWLPEDSWGVTSYLAFLQSVLRSLTPADAVSESLERLPDLDRDAAVRVAEMAVRNAVDSRTLLLVVENLDRVFDALGPDGQAKLRAFLQGWGRAAILATAPSIFSSLSLRTAPFHGFFAVTHLRELSLQDSIELFRRIGASEGRHDLVEFLETSEGRARVRALRHLAGGNHRVHVIFAGSLVGRSIDDMVTALLETLDELTPYHQSRIAELSPQQRRIVEVLADARGAIPVKELARRCLASQQSISSQLGEMRELGVVRSHQMGRESLHELSEPLMRLSLQVRRNRGKPLSVLVELLCAWYRREELELHASTDRVAEPEAPYLAATRDLVATELNPRLEAALHDLRHAADVAANATDHWRDSTGAGLEQASAMVREPVMCAAVMAATLILEMSLPPSEVRSMVILGCVRAVREAIAASAWESRIGLAVLGPLCLESKRAEFVERLGTAWLDAWEVIGDGDARIGTGVRIARAAIQHLNAGDERSVLGLVSEERDLVEQLLRGAPPVPSVGEQATKPTEGTTPKPIG